MMIFDEKELKQMAENLTAYTTYGEPTREDFYKMYIENYVDLENCVDAYNTYLEDTNADYNFFQFDELDDMLANLTPTEIISALCTPFDTNAYLFRYNGYDLESISIEDVIDEMDDDFFEYLCEDVLKIDDADIMNVIERTQKIINAEN